jgi:hypothetical protein
MKSKLARLVRALTPSAVWQKPCDGSCGHPSVGNPWHTHHLTALGRLHFATYGWEGRS